MGGLPDLLFVIDTNKEDIAIKEARRLGVPVAAVVDTNCDPNGITYVVPGNDDASRAITLYCDLVARRRSTASRVRRATVGIDVGAAAEPVSEELPAAAEGPGYEALSGPRGVADDLKKLSHVSPAIEKKLNDLGIFHYWQIAETWSRRRPQDRRGSRSARPRRRLDRPGQGIDRRVARSSRPARSRDRKDCIARLQVGRPCSHGSTHLRLQSGSHGRGWPGCHRPRHVEDYRMANITAQMVKELREKTGAGMMDCKSALGETGAIMEEAVDWLRKKGLAKAAKKAGRIAAEGLIGGRGRRHQGRRGRGQFRDRFRRPQRPVPGPGEDDRRRRPRRRRRRREDQGRQGRQHHRRRGDLRQCRQDRREHDAAARRRARASARAWSRATCTTRSPTASARSA